MPHLHVSRWLFLVASCFLLGGAPAQAGHVPVDFSAFHTDRLQFFLPTLPTGSVTFGGVPFEVPDSPSLNVWHSNSMGGPNPRQIDIPVSIFGVDKVHTLINSLWGETGPGTLAFVEFHGTGGAFYHFDLDGNDDIRDYNPWVHTNLINGTTTINVHLESDGRRLDKQSIDLPSVFLGETLTMIRVSDSGAAGLQRIFLYGVTAETAVSAAVPEPGSLALLSAGTFGLLVYTRRRLGNARTLS